ncbi:MAG: hypothetical protein INR73_13285 [Williamsia sp.]|nr:hypothetical protein [Williamsia sp.]
MRRTLFALLTALCCLSSLHAQRVAIDRNKVLDLFQDQQFDEAISYLSADLSSDSSNLQRLGFLGYAYFMTEDYKTAENFYHRLFLIDSTNITANQYLFIMNENLHPNTAQQFGFRLISLQPGKAAYYRQMADLLRRKNKKDSAYLYYNHAYLIGSGDAKNALSLADMLIEKKQFKRADSILGAGLLKDSLSIPYLKMRVKSAYEANNYADVLIPGEKLLQLEDLSVKPLTQLIISYYNLKRYQDCIRVCEWMASNDLNAEAVYYYEAMAYARMKNYIKSNELLEICLNMAKSPNSEMYYYNLGQNYEAIRQYKKAVSYYDTAFYLFKDPLMNYKAGIICDTRLKNSKAANQYFTKYLARAKPRSADEIKAYEYVKSRWKR